MPDPVPFLQAVSLAGIVAAVLVLLAGWAWRKSSSFLSVAAVLGVGVGFYVGFWWFVRSMGGPPHWPPTEARDRLLFLLLPALILVEFVAALIPRLGWLFWLLRCVIAMGAGRVLLHQSVNLEDGEGPIKQSLLILGSLGAGLIILWAALALLVRRAPGRSVPLAIALACGCAGLTVMLSGNATDGQIGLPLSAALVGVAIASLLQPGTLHWNGVLGVGLIGLFSVLVIGRFFGDLTTLNAVLIFFSPLLCWVPELPYLRGFRPSLRGFARLVLVAAPLALVLVLAQQRFVKDSQQNSSDTDETGQEYPEYGK